MNTQQIKQRFGIIGNSPLLNRAIEIATQVASTDLTVLVTGESGSGKETMPQIIHQMSARKHGPYIAVNCGAIPEGTIDSELFGHKKGAFTGALDNRKGYFEVASGGTIFLDEVGELPIATQARLLRVLESKEFIRVGESETQKTDVRVVAATNVELLEAIKKGKFREDLYYRLNTVPIKVPALRERKEDIHLLFRKFAADMSDKYRMPVVQLDGDALTLVNAYRWPGNVRQLKNITEQLSVIEKERLVNADSIRSYLPSDPEDMLPAIAGAAEAEGLNERELLYKVLFDMKKDLNHLKGLVGELMNNGSVDKDLLQKAYDNELIVPTPPPVSPMGTVSIRIPDEGSTVEETHTEVEENLSLEEKERELISKALKKHNNRRKNAAQELGISERTLYRKIKEYDLT